MKRFLKPVTKQTEAPTSQTPNPLKAVQTKQTSISNSAQQVQKEQMFLFLE